MARLRSRGREVRAENGPANLVRHGLHLGDIFTGPEWDLLSSVGPDLIVDDLVLSGTLLGTISTNTVKKFNIVNIPW